MLALLAAIVVVVGACWGGLSFWRRLQVMQTEIDMLMGELHKLQSESAFCAVADTVRPSVRFPTLDGVSVYTETQNASASFLRATP
jgi:hypothetical protein